MFEAVIEKDRQEITLKYDKERYDIEYVKEQGVFILRRLADNKVVKIFGDNIGFIVQCDKDEQINFMVAEYSKDESGTEITKLQHYVDDSWRDSLQLKKEFECASIWLPTCRVTDNSWLVEHDRYGGCLYNLNKKSKEFKHIFKDERITDMLGGNTLLVSEKVSSRSDIYDTITYGINPETFEITTPIWSEHQHRKINIYTQEQVEQLKEELLEQGRILNTDIYSLGDITISFEVEHYLEELKKYIDEPEGPYLDSWKHNVNEDFVKSFVKK